MENSTVTLYDSHYCNDTLKELRGRILRDRAITRTTALTNTESRDSFREWATPGTCPPKDMARPNLRFMEVLLPQPPVLCTVAKSSYYE